MEILNEIKGVGWILFDRSKKEVGIHRRDGNAPSRAHMWDHFGGGFEADKDKSALDTLMREIYEELSITIAAETVEEISLKEGQVMYLVPFSFEQVSNIRLGEGAGIAWLTLNEALQLSELTQEARDALTILNSL